MRIFLVGFMGSGKSHTGKRLARLLKYDFLDLDKQIESDQNLTISEIFTRLGEDEFRKIERNSLYSTNNRNKLVISCGGGVPCFFDNMDWMNKNGITIFLDAPVPLLVQRLLPGIQKRPLLSGKTEEELEGFIHEKLIERMAFYQKAMITIYQPKLHFDAAGILFDKLFKNGYQ